MNKGLQIRSRIKQKGRKIKRSETMKSADMEILQTFSGKIKEKRDLATQLSLSLNRMSSFILVLLLAVLGLLLLGKTSYAEENMEEKCNE